MSELPKLHPSYRIVDCCQECIYCFEDANYDGHARFYCCLNRRQTEMPTRSPEVSGHGICDKFNGGIAEP